MILFNISLEGLRGRLCSGIRGHHGRRFTVHASGLGRQLTEFRQHVLRLLDVGGYLGGEGASLR